MDLFGKILLGIAVIIVLSMPFAIGVFNTKVDQCNALGGEMIKTPEGWVCFKMIRIEKTT